MLQTMAAFVSMTPKRQSSTASGSVVNSKIFGYHFIKESDSVTLNFRTFKSLSETDVLTGLGEISLPH